MTDQEIIKEARKLYQITYNANKDIKDNFQKDMKFAFNLEEGHWDSDDKSDRKDKGRPALTVNKLAKFVRQVVNMERNTPDKNDVIPVDDKGDKEIAKILNDLIDDIEYQSDFEAIATLAGEYAAGGGYGFWRILTQYTGDGFDQEIVLGKVKNPLMVDVDPRGNYAFVREGLTLDEYKVLDPQGKPDDFEPADDDELWYEDEKVFIAEYFRKVPYNRELVEVYNPQSNETSVMEETEKNKEEIAEYQEIRRRTVKANKVEWYKLSGHRVLERGEWAGKDIPIVEVVGHEIHLGGKTYKQSLIVDAKDCNRMYNYWVTSMTEKVALAPKVPYVLTPQQIAGYEDMWKTANVDNPAYLLYNQTNAGKPTREQSPGIDAEAMTMLNIANNDIQDTLGRYQASIGQPSNERSGKAIQARAVQSDLTTFNFPDNLRRAKVQTRKMLIDLIPRIYDTSRIIRLRNSDTKVQINWETLDTETGEKIILNDLSKGRYDVRVNVINSPSRRQQIVGDILQAMQYAPGMADILLPLLFEFADTPGAEKILEAIRQRSQMITQNMQQNAAQKVNPLEAALQTPARGTYA